MSEVSDIIVSPHVGQAKVLSSNKRIILALAGVQGGKTFVGCLWSQLRLQEHPTGNGLICALTKDQLNISVLDKFFSLFPPYKTFYNKKENACYLPTGAKIFFRSLEEPKYIEGISADWAWMDEGDLATYRGYLIVRGRLGARNGRMLITSSISDNSWILDYSERWDPADYDVFTWASRDNPSFSKEEWEALKRELDPALFRRRYEAEMFHATGRVYGGFDFNLHVLEDVPENDPIDKYFIGIDWGYNDPTAIILVGLSYNKNVYIIRDFSVEGVNLKMILKVLERYRNDYKISGIFADPQNKQMLQSVSDSIHYGIDKGNNDIYYGTQFIRNLIAAKRFFVLKNCVHVLEEIRKYRFKETVDKRSEDPEDKYNHTLDAIRYVVATYPIPTVKYKLVEENQPEVDFWLRRTNEYQREKERQQSRKYVMDEPDDIVIP